MTDLDAQPDPRYQHLLLTSDDASVFADYLDIVANAGLTPYKTTFQHGNKQGESLWTHIVNMASVLAALEPLLELDETEARVLYTALTVHDINKMREERVGFSKLAVQENIAAIGADIGVDEFLPVWRDYLPDIETLVREHSGHYHVGGDSLIVKHDPYRLGGARVAALVHLIRALDVIDLSHTLTERAHKDSFLGHLNTYLVQSHDTRQFAFYTHQVTEQRGLLTNVIHNALIAGLQEQYDLLPLLLYPDGVAYLGERDTIITLSKATITHLGVAVTQGVQGILAGDTSTLVEQTKDGCKIKPEAFTLGARMPELWLAVRNEIARRSFKPAEYDQKARAGAARSIQRRQKKQPDYGQAILARLDDPAPIVQATEAQFRAAELARAYYWFLKTTFDGIGKPVPDDPWRTVYALLELPEEQWDFYDYFNATNHRLYVLAGDIALAEETVSERLLADAMHFVQSGQQATDVEPTIWGDYVQRYVLINGRPLTDSGWADHVAHYMTNQHGQCVTCSGPFPTNDWMSRDVRDGIKVEKFSYRLRGGSNSAPKKQVCEVCRTQYLLEVLNYPPVRGEHTLYLHLFPYSFYPAPFVNALRGTLNRLRGSGLAVQALNMNPAAVMQNLIEEHDLLPDFRLTTKAGKPHTYGAYVPQYAETAGGTMIFPVNAPGDNDTERFLFALWYALVLQRHFGVKVILSDSPLPPLDLHAIPDLYLDGVPLGCSGLLKRNDYRIFSGDGDAPGPLRDLWHAVGHLFALDRLIGMEDIKPGLMRALLDGPLGVFHRMDRLLEKKHKEHAVWVGRDAYPHVRDLALLIGGKWMVQLSEQLTQLAALAWGNRLIGRTLKRSSLLSPVDEIFTKLARIGGPLDRDAVIAMTVTDIFAHLERIADDQYKPVSGGKKYQAVEAFVRLWYDGVLDGVYGGNVQRLLADEKLLRSAYLFYLQAQIPRRSSETENIENEEE